MIAIDRLERNRCFCKSKMHAMQFAKDTP